MKRRLGLTDAVTIGLGSMIGAGVFAAFAPAAAAAGSALLIGLAAAAVVAYCNAMSSARLAQAAILGASSTFILDSAPTSPAPGMAALPTTSIPSPSSSGVSTPRDPLATLRSRPARGARDSC